MKLSLEKVNIYLLVVISSRLKHMNCTLMTKDLPTSIMIIIFRNTCRVVVKISGPWTRLSAFEF